MRAAFFSNIMRLSSAVFSDGRHAVIKIGHRHESVMLVSMAAAPRFAASRKANLFVLCSIKLVADVIVPAPVA
jgi:hypothetical protein